MNMSSYMNTTRLRNRHTNTNNYIFHVILEQIDTYKLHTTRKPWT
uniref:Uncharacterized protein n=1 Tax=Arundo donax TaxID=35708 RepID=A0A0A9BJH3_ARUDO